ncbi:pyruvate kinase [Haloimpatiens sp. FM7330]|uniref:pyruvate kinase n=1 Tax=Haloimpatiens sp. FM7330 TaxID=3298610 RepID=UPI0036319C9D
MRKTKIVCTIGPASDSREMLSKLIEAGLNASRHNFSHGDHAEHKMRMDLVKELRKQYNKPIAIVLDTKGPEIRTGNFKDGAVELEEGQKFTIVSGEEVIGDKTICSVTYDDLCKDVKIGDTILIDDGLVGLQVENINGNKIECVVKNSGEIGNHKGINVPGVSINLPALTEKDKADLLFGIEQDIDMIAASFIRKASDVLEIRKLLAQNGGNDIKIFSKIESQEGVNNIDDIIKFSDGIMVARGDLGVEIPTEEVPVVQKMIIEKCNKIGKPVITATQMLDSMIRNPRPTRAEASDVANAILDGTDAIMLSGETAKGKWAEEAVTTMAKIAKRIEESINYKRILKKKMEAHIPNVANAISLSTCTTASQLKAAAIITATQSGNTARRVSKYRPECPIIAATPSEKVARRLALNWGVFPIVTSTFKTTDELINESVNEALKYEYINKGDLVVIAAGIPAQYSGTTNMLKVHIVGDILVQGKGAGNKPAYGIAHVINSPEEANKLVQEGEILVVKTLDKEYIDVLDRVVGVIAEEGGLTSHMSIECLTRDIPVISAAADATTIVKTGSFITMDATRGVIYSGRANIR